MTKTLLQNIIAENLKKNINLKLQCALMQQDYFRILLDTLTGLDGKPIDEKKIRQALDDVKLEIVQANKVLNNKSGH